MEITQVRIRLHRAEKLRAFCSITLDEEFVVHDFKVLENHLRLYVAVPTRRMTARCPYCGSSCPLTDRYCGRCGKQIPSDWSQRTRFNADTAHPITSEFRSHLEESVLSVYRTELAASRRPDYDPQRTAVYCWETEGEKEVVALETILYPPHHPLHIPHPDREFSLFPCAE